MPLRNVGESVGATAPLQMHSNDRLDMSTLKIVAGEQRFPRADHVLARRWFEAGTVPSTTVATTALNEFIAFELSLVLDVEYVFTAFRNEVFYVWILVKHFEEEIRTRIYDRERAIIDAFPTLDFDFYVIARLDRDPWDLVSESVVLAYQKGH